MTSGRLRALTAGVWANTPIEFYLGDPARGGVRLEVKARRMSQDVTEDGTKPAGPPRLMLIFHATDLPPLPDPVAQTVPTDPPEAHVAIDHVPGMPVESDVLLAVP